VMGQNFDGLEDEFERDLYKPPSLGRRTDRETAKERLSLCRNTLEMCKSRGLWRG
jgi:hypothetical protein